MRGWAAAYAEVARNERLAGCAKFTSDCHQAALRFPIGPAGRAAFGGNSTEVAAARVRVDDGDRARFNAAPQRFLYVS